MKLENVAVATVAASLPAFVRSYVCGPNLGRGRAFTPEQQARRIKEQQERINRSFENLKEDLNRQKEVSMGNESEFGPYMYTFGMVDEDALRKQKGLANKVFDLAEEFNSEFAPSKEEAKMNDDFLKKSRDWINRLYQATEKPKTETKENNADGTSDEDTMFTPRFDIFSTEERFEVTLDVPGVGREDIDISLQEGAMTLTIRGERSMNRPSGGDNEDSPRKMKFSLSFDLDEDVDVNKLTAELDKGVLLVSAPKKAKPENGETRKIPLM